MSTVNSLDLSDLTSEISDIRESSLNNTNFDLTSILKSLETGKIDIYQKNYNYLDILDKDLTLFENWTDNILKTSLDNIEKHLLTYKFLHRLHRLSKKLNSIYGKNLTGLNTKSQRYTWKCPYCCESLVKGKCKDVLNNIEKHTHCAPHFQNFKICPKEEKSVKLVKKDSEMSSSSSGTSSVSRGTSSESERSSKKDLIVALPSYIEKNYVTETFYPLNFLKKVFEIQQKNIVTIQRFKPNGYDCLICYSQSFTSEELVFKHLKKKGHQKSLNDKNTIELLTNYFKTFTSFKDNLVFHQGVIRIGISLKTFRCKICRATLPIANIVEHISGSRHKKAIDEGFKTYYFCDNMVSDITQPKPNNENAKPVSKEENNTPIIPKTHNITPSLMENPKTLFDSIETRLRPHEKLFKIQNDKVTCIPCKVDLIPLKENISYHITTTSHFTYAKSEINRLKWFYVCDLCIITERSELRWYNHVNSPAHKQRLDALNLNGTVFQEYECKECLLVLFGNAQSVEKHLKQPVNKKQPKKKKEFKLTITIEKMFSNKKLLDDKISRLMLSADATLEMDDLNIQCCRAISDAIKIEFPSCRAFPFGSRVTGIGTLDSDLDVFVDTGSMFDGLIYQDPESQTNIVRQVTKLLRRHPDFTDINPIPQARTPIIQVFHKVTRIDCDLSFRHGLSVENTEYLRLCIDVQPAIKPMILILKFWLHQGYFDRITTYALCMLIIFYMQLNNYAPTVKMLREIDPTPSRVIAGWHTFRYTKPLEDLISKLTPCTLTTRELMIDFFKYYSNFNYDEHVVCPLLGEIIPKASFDEVKGVNLPAIMQTYIDKIKDDPNYERFRHLTPMCIQDPFDLSHNLTKACPKEYLPKFTTLCSQSHKLLSDIK